MHCPDLYFLIQQPNSLIKQSSLMVLKYAKPIYLILIMIETM